MVTGKFKLTNPNDLEAVAEISMTLGEWRDLRKDLTLGNTYTAMSFRHVIDGLIEQADKTFYARGDQ